jgi:hypothetical protein
VQTVTAHIDPTHYACATVTAQAGLHLIDDFREPEQL